MRLDPRSLQFISAPAAALTLALLCACGVTPDENSAPAPGVAPNSAAASAAPLPDVAPVIQSLATQGGSKDSTAEMRLTFTGEGGKAEQLDFRLQRRAAPGGTATLLTVLAPREETAKSLLAFERPGQPTEALSYLAGLKSLTRLGSDRPLNFRGTRSTVQELLGMELNQYEPQRVERASEGGAALLKVDLKAKDDRRLAFPRIAAFFRETAQGLEPSRFELYNSRGEAAKVVRVAEYKPVQGYPTITRAEVEDREQKRKLELVTREIKYDRALPASLFTEDHLIKAVTEASQKLVR
jgi:hypothetical protein